MSKFSSCCFALQLALLLYLRCSHVEACLGNLQIPRDPDKQIPTLVEALRLEKGNSRYEGAFPPRTDAGIIYESSDLDCKNFENCAWRNELGKEGAPNVDEFDWGVASGRPDPTKAVQVFGTSHTSFPADNSGKWLITGTMQGGDKKDSDGSLLVSDPVSCQIGPGKFSFKYWASPDTQVRVCTRRPNDGKNYIQCQPNPSSPPWYRQYFTFGWPSPGPVEVTIPANPNPFEIVIEAKKFNYFVSANGRSGKGGVVALDDISYKATLCDRPATTRPPPPPTTRPPTVTPQGGGTVDPTDRFPCELIFCSVDQGECTSQLSAPGSNWEVRNGRYGNPHTGVKQSYDGAYAVARGPSNTPVGLSMGPFVLSTDRALKFCFYRAYHSVYMTVNQVADGEVFELYRSPPLRSNPEQAYTWTCEEIQLDAGRYDELNLEVHGLESSYSYFALDDVQLLEAPGGIPLC